MGNQTRSDRTYSVANDMPNAAEMHHWAMRRAFERHQRFASGHLSSLRGTAPAYDLREWDGDENEAIEHSNWQDPPELPTRTYLGHRRDCEDGFVRGHSIGTTFPSIVWPS